MGNLAARILTALVLLPILIAAIRWSNPIGVWAIVYVATFLGLREFYNMTLAREPAAERYFGVALGMAFAAVVYWLGGRNMAVTGALAGVTVGAFLFYLF